MLLITYYTDAAAPLPRTFKVETGEDRLYTIYMLDGARHGPLETIASDNGEFATDNAPEHGGCDKIKIDINNAVCVKMRAACFIPPPQNSLKNTKF